MTIASRTFTSPNYYKEGWTKGPPRAVVIHSTRSTVASKTDAQELQSTINWFMSVNSQASSHWVVSELERVRMVEDKYPAWHAVEHSWEAYGIEITQPTIDRPYKEGHYQNLVAVCVPYVQAGIPVIHLPILEYGDSRRGFVGHDETQQGRRDGKSDPGPQFDWAKFIGMLTTTTEVEMPLSDADYPQFHAMLVTLLNSTDPKYGNAAYAPIIAALRAKVAALETQAQAAGLKRGDTVKIEGTVT